MEIFEVIINEEAFKISRNSPDCYIFNIFNHTTFHVIQKNEFGIWEDKEHRFGTDNIPLNEIGKTIDKHYYCEALKDFGLLGNANL